MSTEQLACIQQRCRQTGLECLADAIASHGNQPEPLTENVEVSDNLPPTWKELFETTGMFATYSVEEVEEIDRVTRGQCMCPLWSKYRAGMVTSSIAHRVYTWIRSTTNNPRQRNAEPLVNAILTKRDFQTSAMKRGVCMEPEAKDYYVNTHTVNHENLKILERGLCVLPGCPFIGASPDGILQCDCCLERILEVKCPMSIQKFLDRHVKNEKLKKTSLHYTQMQVQMGATGLNSGVLLVYHNEERPVEITVPFDSDHYLSVVRLVRVFYSNYVAPRLGTTQCNV